MIASSREFSRVPELSDGIPGKVPYTLPVLRAILAHFPVFPERGERFMLVSYLVIGWKLWNEVRYQMPALRKWRRAFTAPHRLFG